MPTNYVAVSPLFRAVPRSGWLYLGAIALVTQLTFPGQIAAQNIGDNHHNHPRIISFDAPDAQGTTGVAINRFGVIAGYYSDSNSLNHGFLRVPDGHITTFDGPGAGGFGTFSTGLNEEGAVVGAYTDANYEYHGFLRRPDGRINTFTAPKACTGGLSVGCEGTAFNDINLFGGILGAYLDTNFVTHGFVISPYGKFTEFDAPGAGDTSGQYQGTQPASIFWTGSTSGLNNLGASTGYYVDTNSVAHGFVRNPDGSIVSFDPSGSTLTIPGSINDEGTVTGYYSDSNGVAHGFVRKPKGRITTFDAPGAGSTATSGEGTFPSSINLFGSVDGSYTDTKNVNHGFVRFADGKIITFDAPTAGTASGQGTFPFSNNDEDAITGFYIDSNGTYHGFVRIR